MKPLALEELEELHKWLWDKVDKENYKEVETFNKFQKRFFGRELLAAPMTVTEMKRALERNAIRGTEVVKIRAWGRIYDIEFLSEETIDEEEILVINAMDGY